MGRFFLDENIQSFLAAPLRRSGHEIKTVQEAGINRAPDSQVILEAAAFDGAVLTADLDFANILRFPLGTHSGIVVLRLKRMDIPAKVERVIEAIEYEMVEDVRGCLVILTLFRLGTVYQASHVLFASIEGRHEFGS